MDPKWIYRRGLLIAVGSITLYSLCLAGCEPRPGKVIETWEVTNNEFKVRVQIYDEGSRAHIFEPGCHVQLASAKAGSNEWYLFSSAYYSHCDQIPKDHVRFVTDKTAYVFMQWWYAMTADGGITWSSWDVAGHLSGRVYYNPRLIQDVSIGPDGSGAMTLNPEGVRGNEPLKVYTQDFGLHWNTQ